MVVQELAKTYFAEITRTVALRAICDLADIDSEPTGPNDCWVASKKLYHKEGRTKIDFDNKYVFLTL